MKNILSIMVIIILLIYKNALPQDWQWIDTGYPYIIFDMCFPPGQNNIGYAVGSTLTFGGDGVILKTMNGGLTWNKISTDTIPGLKTVCFTSPDAGYVGGYQNYLLKTIDGGSSWSFEVIDSKLWYFNNIEFWDNNYGIAVSYPSSVYFTTDGGLSWMPSLGIKHSVEDICYASASILYLVGGDEKIYKSTDSGFFWTEIYGGVTLQLFFGVEFLNENYGIVTGENGKVLITTDGGANWLTSNAGSSGLMRGVHILTEQNSYVVGSPEQIYKTTDGGLTWTNDFAGGNTIALYKVEFTENLTGLICGSQGRFLRNTEFVIPVELSEFTASIIDSDVQLNWTTKTELNNSGFEIQRLVHGSDWKSISFVPGHGTTSEPRNYSYTDNLLIGGNYFYRLKQLDFDGSSSYSDILNADVSVPEKFVLEQNFPNPFNPTTSIKFSIPEATHVKMNILNILGELIETLLDTRLDNGNFELKWDAGDNASGIYYYELITDNYYSIKKMILLK